MNDKFHPLETERLALQATLDGAKTSIERNILGQFATPTTLARDVLAYGLSILPEAMPVRFLDPAIGTGSFYSALRATSAEREITSARGIEIDPHYGEPAIELWKDTPIELTLGDFTKIDPPSADQDKVTLLISNPPYVRHHHLEKSEKPRLQALGKASAGMKLSGLAGLYCYFMALSHRWMAKCGIAGWLIPSEFMDVNYGRVLKEYLLRDVTLLHIHRFDPTDVQFDDALVSSAVVWIKNEKPPADHCVKFSYGGSLASPATIKEIPARVLKPDDKWTRFPKHDPTADHEGYRLSDLFAIKRGLATGNNSFFILDEARIKELGLPEKFLRAILPSSRYIKDDEIQADADGVPLLEKRLFLLDCDIPEEEVKRDYPALWAYLQTGAETTAEGYLCKSRKFWYAQEKRFAAPIICTYMGRSDHDGKPFRFLLNHSRATATNVFLMLYPQPLLAAQLDKHPDAIRILWEALNAIKPEVILGNGRVYGGGLHKLEPKELANVNADELAALVGLPKKVSSRQLDLIEAIAA
jgi:hypothetical protein